MVSLCLSPRYTVTSIRFWQSPPWEKENNRQLEICDRSQEGIVQRQKKKHLETAKLDMCLEHDRKGDNTHEDCQRPFWKKYGSSEKEEIAVLTTLLLLGRMDTLGFITVRKKNQVHLLNGAQSTSYHKPSKPLYKTWDKTLSKSAKVNWTEKLSESNPKIKEKTFQHAAYEGHLKLPFFPQRCGVVLGFLGLLCNSLTGARLPTTSKNNDTKRHPQLNNLHKSHSWRNVDKWYFFLWLNTVSCGYYRYSSFSMVDPGSVSIRVFPSLFCPTSCCTFFVAS